MNKDSNDPIVQNNLYELIFKHTTDPVIILDHSLNIIDINLSACDLFGFTKNEIKGLSLTKDNKLRFCLSKDIIKLNVGGFLRNVRHDITNQKGITYPITWFIQKIQNSDQIILIGNLLIDHITSSKPFLHNNKDEEIAILKNVIANLPGHLYWKDKNGIYLGSNEGNIEFAGLSSEKNIIGKTDYELPWHEHADKFTKIDNKVIKTGKTITVEEKGKNHDGTLLYGLSQKTPLRDSKGNIIGIIGNSIDITQLKETQLALKKAITKAQAANKAKTEFIMNISHDIRTPFTGVLGISRFMLSHEDDPTKKKQLGYIVKSAEKLLNLLNEIIDLSKIESGKLPLETQVFNFRQFIQDVADIVSSSIQQKGLQLIIEYPEHIPQMIKSDLTRLQRILLNLLGNAIKFTKEGHIAIIIKSLSISQDKHQMKLEIVIEDTGMGIPKDQFNNIFTKFSRVTASYSGKDQGTGLGLHIVKQFIKDLHGTIDVNSQLNKGTRFICTLSVELPTEAELNSLSQKDSNISETATDQIKTALKILLIEDDPIAQYITDAIITELGQTVSIANNGTEALPLLAKQKYDLIITDIGLPDINGIDLAKKIRQDLRITTPIVALTAHTPLEYVSICNKAGINELLIKPIDKNELLKILRIYFAVE